MAKRGEPDDAPDFSDPEELERAVNAEQYRQWRENQAAGWSAVPDPDRIREELTRPERERREAEEAEKRKNREEQRSRILDLQERLLAARLEEREKQKRGAHPKEYEGARVEHAVRLAAAGDTRNGIAKKTGLSTYAVDLILGLVARGELADAGQRGRLVIEGELSATPPFIPLNARRSRF